MFNRTVKCVDCGYVFDIEDAGGVRENHWLDGEYMGSETFLVCPNCGGDFEDAVECCECGEVFTEDEIYGDKWCEKCLRETINYDTFFEYCEANKDFHYIEIFIMQYTLEMDCPDDISTGFHNLMVDTYKRNVAVANMFPKTESFIDKCVQFIMDDDGSIGRENYADWLNKMEVK